MNNRNRLSRWLDVPSLSDPVERRNAPLLQLVLITLATVPLLIWIDRVIELITWQQKDVVNLSFNLAMSVIALWSIALIRRGKFQFALHQFLVVIVIATTASHATIGLAENNSRIPVQLLWLFIAGLMAGRNALWGMCAGMSVAVLAGAIFDIRHGLAVNTTIGSTVARIIMYALVGLIIDRSTSALRESLQEAVARGQELELANTRLQAEMTARQNAQAQLLHAQKVEAVGRMASGLAHDFGHLLTLVDGYASQVKPTSTRDEVAQAVEGVRSASARARSQVRKLLHFTLEEPLAKADTFDAIEAMEDAKPMLRQILGPRIRFTFQGLSTPAPITIDRDQFIMILINVAANAADAMPETGAFFMTTRITQEDQTLEIVMRDSGYGVAEDQRAQIFEPFFTTRASTGGTGVGLAVSRDLVVLAGGSLELAPDHPEGGASFCLRLPLATSTI